MLILVTGASRGIGLELVKKLASQKGNLVLAVSRNIKPLKKLSSSNHSVLPVKADITVSKDIASLAGVVRRLGMPLSVLVNNAGLLVKKDFEKMGLQDLKSTFVTNVYAPYLLIQKLLPYMSKKGAHVVNISSMGGVQGTSKFPGLSAYSSSKGALSVLTECLAEELKPRKVSVNCLALGAVQTEMLTAAFPGYRAPLVPSEMADFIAEFATQGARFFNGKIIPVSQSTP